MQTAVQTVAVICGLIAAFLWWRSSRIRLQPSQDLPKNSKDGNLGVVLANGDTLFWDIDKQGQLNAWAAGTTAISTLLQALTIVLQSH